MSWVWGVLTLNQLLNSQIIIQDESYDQNSKAFPGEKIFLEAF